MISVRQGIPQMNILGRSKNEVHRFQMTARDQFRHSDRVGVRSGKVVEIYVYEVPTELQIETKESLKDFGTRTVWMFRKRVSECASGYY